MPSKSSHQLQPNPYPEPDEPAGSLVPALLGESRQSALVGELIVRLLTSIDRSLRLLRQNDRQPDDWLTVAQAAVRASVSQTTIRRAMRLKDGPDKLLSKNVGNGRMRPTLRIDPKDFDAWCKRREGRPPAPAVRTVRVSAVKSGQFKF